MADLALCIEAHQPVCPRRATERASDGDVHDYFSPYGRPHEAYMTFMNVLHDLGAPVAPTLAGPSPRPAQARPSTTKKTKPTRRNRR